MDTTGLGVGDYTGSVTITDSGADNSPAAVAVYLSVKAAGADLPLIGSIGSPIDGSTVSGSIPVTGWALDDTEISVVQIFRNAVLSGESGESGDIYIGDAVLVEGARPDVELQFPEYPRNYLAGWGYMMLSNFLPNGGNGTFVITAIATDGSGNPVVLGSKTVLCDNENALKPFGTIDTPAQGGEISGSGYINNGWMLTPLPNTIPTDGSTIRIWVDGVSLPGNPAYNASRPDIAALFSGYNNSDAAGGFYYLDTTLYANGIHTISWTVMDDGGNSDGIGSRYFKILNDSADSVARVSSFSGRGGSRNAVLSPDPVSLRRGYDSNSAPQILLPDSNGSVNIEFKQAQRIAIDLNLLDKESDYRYWGYLQQGKEQKELPVGSSLDSTGGVFYWQPGPALTGS